MTDSASETPRTGKAKELFRRDLKRGKPRRNVRPDSDAGARGARSPRGLDREAQQKSHSFVLYVEGPRDLEILGYWAKRVDSSLARCIDENTVILGGKRPARAIADFEKRGGAQAGLSGLIVLDRDDHNGSDHDELRSTASQVGLEIFVWEMRHIESYLLVPDAIRRVLSFDLEDNRIEELIRHQNMAEASQISPASHASGDSAEHSIHAKRILGANGALTEGLGVEVKAGEIARAMRREEIHDDVLALFGRVRALSGLAESGPEVEVIVRKPRSESRP